MSQFQLPSSSAGFVTQSPQQFTGYDHEHGGEASCFPFDHR